MAVQLVVLFLLLRLEFLPGQLRKSQTFGLPGPGCYSLLRSSCGAAGWSSTHRRCCAAGRGRAERIASLISALLFPRGGIQSSVCTRRQVSSNCPGFILLSGIVSLIQQRTTPESSSVENENKRLMHQPDQHEKYVARDVWLSRFGHRTFWSSSRSVVICWRF